MKKFLLAGAALAALATGAQAADLGAVRSPIPGTVVAPAGFNWTGFYLGANIGYGMGNTGWQYLPIPGNRVNSNPVGILGGVQLGYNWQVAPNGVIGIETDLGIAAMNDRDLCPNPAFTCRSRNSWLGSTRLRAGFTADRALFYVTGGLGYGDMRIRTETPVNVLAGQTTRTNIGFVVGAGLEYAIAQNWSIRGEYLYYNLGTARYNVDNLLVVRATHQAHTFRLGVNYLFTTGGAVSARY